MMGKLEKAGRAACWAVCSGSALLTTCVALYPGTGIRAPRTASCVHRSHMFGELESLSYLGNSAACVLAETPARRLSRVYTITRYARITFTTYAFERTRFEIRRREDSALSGNNCSDPPVVFVHML